MLDLTKLNAENNLKLSQMIMFVFKMVENIVEKRDGACYHHCGLSHNYCEIYFP